MYIIATTNDPMIGAALLLERATSGNRKIALFEHLAEAKAELDVLQISEHWEEGDENPFDWKIRKVIINDEGDVLSEDGTINWSDVAAEQSGYESQVLVTIIHE